MPVKSNIDLGEGRLYFSGLEDSIEVRGGEIECEPEYYDDQKPYIKNFTEPATFTCETSLNYGEWTLAKCQRCGYKFPITIGVILRYGTDRWLCPECSLNRRLKKIEWCKYPIWNM